MPKTMSPEALARARDFLDTHARPLERARVAQRLDGVPAHVVLAELERFQNLDGGFGRALDPDLRSPSSSPFVTSVAFQLLRELEVPSEVPMVRAALHYLELTYDPEARSWPVTPSDTAAFPHAPWWARPESARPDPANLNPRAELLGVWLERPVYAGSGQLEALQESVRARLAEVGAELEMHELLSVRRLAETPGLDPAWRAELSEQLHAAARRSVGATPEDWAGYGLRPTEAAPHPEGILGPALREASEAYCDHLLDTQDADGSWAPTWSWAESYPEAWQLAEREWRGVLVERHLEVLAAYGRLPR